MIWRTDTNKKPEDQKLKELIAGTRHYSTLRFAMLTVYFGVTGGLLTKYFDHDFFEHYSELRYLFPIAGVIITAAFFIFEYVLNDNLSCLWVAIEKLAGKDDVLLSHRQPWKKYLIPAATYTIFVGTLLFWLTIFWKLYSS